MSTDRIIELAFFCLPALITGGVAYYLFNTYLENENKKRMFLMHRENRKQALPLKLQAYERMTLFLERIDPTKLLIRVSPLSDNPQDYANFVISQVDQEFEHNLSQQIYVSDECWGYIVTAKNATIQNLRKYAAMTDVQSADEYRQRVLKDAFDTATPSTAGLAYIRSEVKELI